MAQREYTDWERHLERRVERLELKMEKLLDPETGVYPKIEGLYLRLTRWGIALLAAMLVNVVVVVLVGKPL